MNQLDKLKLEKTIIVADTGDIDEIKKLQPQDATTNPSLILKESKKRKREFFNNMAVDIGCDILKEVPGYVSTEVNPKYSFSLDDTLNEAREIINLYKNKGADTKRILIKIAATWQGIKAAEILENEGIKCNLTLIFSLTQARACAEAGVTLISPFVGRVTDWYSENNISFDEDPGVKCVSEIYYYFKKYNYKTIIMGASFRNIDQVAALSGCDRLTINPTLITELSNKLSNVKSVLNEKIIFEKNKPDRIKESDFYLELAKNKMATCKLNEGILKFIEDTEKIISF